MILEAMEIMQNCPVGFVVQSKFDDNTFYRRFTPKVPLVGRIVIKNAIKNGEIYLRPDKVDSSLPDTYILKGWHVRNMSMRKDPITLSNGSVHLKKRGKS